MALPGRLRQWSETKTRLPRAVQSVGGWWPSWQSVTLDIVREESLDLADRAFYARVTRRRITTCCGWRIACWDLVATQQEELRSFFRPAPEFERRAADFVGELRANHDVIVGLFIRQSDYREWNDGRFYFSTESYVVWLRQLLDLYQGKRVAFVIASEERQAEALFAGLPVYFATGTPNAGGHWFESWVELSCCDVIVSPPSTFSATAAFLGDLPIWPLVAGDQALAFDQLIPDGMIGASRHPVFGLAVK